MIEPDQIREQRARAERLREQIARLTGKGGGAEPTSPSSDPPSARDFIEEKMRELRRQEHKGGE
jgi:hypothetical protein